MGSSLMSFILLLRVGFLASSFQQTAAEKVSCVSSFLENYCTCPSSEFSPYSCHVPNASFQLEYYSKSELLVLSDDSAAKGSASGIVDLPVDLLDAMPPASRLRIQMSNLSSLPEHLLLGSDEGNLWTGLELLSPSLKSLPQDIFAETNHLELVMLKGSFLEVLPKTAPCSAVNFMFIKNHISELPEGFFDCCSVLHNVDLSFNKLVTLPVKVFSQNQNLETLSLKNNKLKILPAFLFHNCLKLEDLDLSNNVIESLSPELFPQAGSSVRFVSLQKNNLTKVSRQLFSELESLEELDLSFNKLYLLPEGWLGSCRKLRVLNLERNDLRTVLPSLIYNCSLLRVLNLRHNKLISVPDKLLTRCSHLSFLSLDFNNIRELPAGLLHSCSELEDLSISNNRLQELPSDLLFHSPHLSSVILSGNGIENMPLNFTINIVSLQYFDLSMNRITWVSSHVPFAVPVDSYYLQNNALTNLTMSMFDWITLQNTLDVSHNFISVLDFGWAVGLENLRVLKLSYNNLTSIATKDLALLKNLHTLNLDNNQIMFIEFEAFHANYRLQYLDLSYNELKGFGNEYPLLPASVQLLNISRNQVTDLPASWTAALIDARGNPLQLNGYVNFIMSSAAQNSSVLIDDEIFKCGWYNHSTTTTDELYVECSSPPPCPQMCRCSKETAETVIDCHNGSLTVMPDVFHTSATTLHLEDNEIKNILYDLSKESWKKVQYLYLRHSLDSSNLHVSDRLPDLLHLKFLDLAHNGLSYPLLPQRFPQLQVLNLSHNTLQLISNDTFANATSLEILDLSHNILHYLSVESLRGLGALQQLLLSGNQLTSWAKVWDSLPFLSRLHLNSNALKDIPLDTFEAATYLEFLDLHENALGLEHLFRLPSSLLSLDMSDTSFNGSFTDKYLSSNITFITLRGNEVRDVQLGLRAKENASLLVVDLTGNAIEHLALASRHSKQSQAIVHVYLENNPILCDCTLIPLLSTVQHSNSGEMILHFQGVRCSQPAFLAGQLLATLSTDQLLCQYIDGCPSMCHCYLASDNSTIIDCSGASNLTRIPILKYGQFVRELYLDGLGTVESLDGLKHPSWQYLTVLSLTGCCPDMDNLNTTILKYLHNIQRMDLTEKCWCRFRDFILSNPSGFTGSCRYSLPAPRCVQQPDSSHWSMVQCSSTFEPSSRPTLKVPACFVYEHCSECSCYFDLHNTLVMNCSLRNMIHLPLQAPPGVEVLDMDGNALRTLHGLGQWQTLKELTVRNNKLEELNDAILPAALKLVSLEGNQLRRTSGWLSHLLKGKLVGVKVWLSKNSWSCDCGILPISESADLFSVVIDSNQTYCTNRKLTDKELLIDAILNCTKKAEYDTWVSLITGVAVSLGLLVVIAGSAAIWFRHRHAFRLWMFEHHCCFVGKENLQDDGKEYDAFIAYSSDDAEFVANHLLIGLERAEESRFQFRLCIHERDWLGGELITEQIVRSIHSSRRTIIVLTDNFAASSWSTLEFRVALQQALEDRVNRLIIVVPGLLPPSHTLPPDLRLFVAMNTYLLFTDPKFWEKLRYAMPHKEESSSNDKQLRRMPEEFVELMNSTSVESELRNSSSTEQIVMNT